MLVHIVEHSLLSWLDGIPHRHLQCREDEEESEEVEDKEEEKEKNKN